MGPCGPVRMGYVAVAATAPLGLHASHTGPAATHPTDAERSEARKPDYGALDDVVTIWPLLLT